LQAYRAALKKYLKKIFRLLLILLAALFFSSFCYTLYLRWFPPFTTPLMLMRVTGKSDPQYQISGISSQWINYSRLSSNMKLAVITSEDQRFSTHSGFDYEAIEKAIKHNRRSKRVRGASTISQQVAKNVFLWPGRSYLRKGLEVYFTVMIEALWPKERILEMYLNVIETGNGVFGVQAAARKYFHEDASALSPAQAALIAAVLPNPRLYNAAKPSSYIRHKQAWIQREMKEIGKEYLDEL
jgi:monofunctional biosynthetic peptidoglycan transglycosylase